MLKASLMGHLDALGRSSKGCGQYGLCSEDFGLE